MNVHETAVSIAQSSGQLDMVATIEKELLHYEILNAMDEAGFLDSLTFQGGTSLRLCYGAVRYSEDLDFSGGKQFNEYDFADLHECIKQALYKRYHVQALVNAKPARTQSRIRSWTVVIDTTPTRRDIARQKIKIEVAAINAHTAQYRNLTRNYEHLPVEYDDIILRVESLEEILADKIEAFVCSPHMRYRDLWDLQWLSRQPNLNLNQCQQLRHKKSLDYDELHTYQHQYPQVQEKLDTAFTQGTFEQEMKRFLPITTIKRTINRTTWQHTAHATLQQLFTQFPPAPTPSPTTGVIQPLTPQATPNNTAQTR